MDVLITDRSLSLRTSPRSSDGLERSLVRAVLMQTFTEKLEFPFLPDEVEHFIISMAEDRSILLVGRSGTGKTTIVVQRLWLHYRVNYERRVQLLMHKETTAADDDVVIPQLHQLFVTANPILRTSVSKSFKALQLGYITSSGSGGDTNTGVEDEGLQSLCGLRDQDWPLFLRAHNWLRLLDATLAEPFFSAAERTEAASRTSGWHSEAGVMDSLLEIGNDEEEEYDKDAGDGQEEEAEFDDEDGDDDSGARQNELGGASGRVEITFDIFENLLWPHMLTHKATAAHKLTRHQLKEQARSPTMRRTVAKSPLKASMVFREICSYIKGSSESLDCENGYLSREAYFSVGRKMAPSFEKTDLSTEGDVIAAGGSSSSAATGRARVYELFLLYEEWKVVFQAYDVMDVVLHMYRQLRRDGYNGDSIDEIYIDEVQDFTQVSFCTHVLSCSSNVS